MAGTWTDDHVTDPRFQAAPAGEKETYAAYLDAYRLTVRMKCEGLDAGQLARRSVPPSTLSLLGLVRHLARIEHHWFSRVLAGRPDLPRLYDGDDPDLAFTGAVADPDVVREAFATWDDRVAASRAVLDRFADEALGDEVPDGEGGVIVIRDLVLMVVAEHARHTGHVDLLRECIDGRTGQ